MSPTEIKGRRSENQPGLACGVSRLGGLGISTVSCGAVMSMRGGRLKAICPPCVDAINWPLPLFSVNVCNLFLVQIQNGRDKLASTIFFGQCWFFLRGRVVSCLERQGDDGQDERKEPCTRPVCSQAISTSHGRAGTWGVLPCGCESGSWCRAHVA